MHVSCDVLWSAEGVGCLSSEVLQLHLRAQKYACQL
jgi:hypothetical protein